PTSTTKMTGFFATTLGSSLRNASRVARFMISGSNSGRARTARVAISGDPGRRAGFEGAVSVVAISTRKRKPQHCEQLSALHEEVLHDGSERQGREEGQRAHDDHGPDQYADKERAVRRQGPARDRYSPLC